MMPKGAYNDQTLYSFLFNTLIWSFSSTTKKKNNTLFAKNFMTNFEYKFVVKKICHEICNENFFEFCLRENLGGEFRLD